MTAGVTRPRVFAYDMGRSFLGLGRKNEIELELRADGALVPKQGFGANCMFVKYTDIVDIQLHELSVGGGQPDRMLTVEARDGKGVMQARRFTSEGRFDDFANDLVARWQASRAPKPAVAAAPRPVPSAPRPAAEAARTHAPQPVEPPASNQDDASMDSMLRAIESQRASDPYIGAKIAGKEVLHRLMKAMRDDKGIHAPSLLCALGAVAGHACQATVRAQAIAARKPPDANFTIVTTKDGAHYLFGDALNRLLLGNELSVWSLAGGAAQAAGAKSIPDVLEMVRYSAQVLGTPKFGIPRLPPGINTGTTPIDFATHLWPAVRPVVEKLTGNPKLWSLAVAFAIQDAIRETRDAVPPELALRIVMESAIPVSNIRIED